MCACVHVCMYRDNNNISLGELEVLQAVQGQSTLINNGKIADLKNKDNDLRSASCISSLSFISHCKQ